MTEAAGDGGAPGRGALLTLPEELVRHTGQEVTLGARVIALGEGQLVLELSGTRIVAACAPGAVLPAVGSFVRARGRWDGARLHGATLELVTAPGPRFGHANGEAAWAGRGAPMLAKRAALKRAVLGFFEARGFLEVDTPVVVRNPGIELHLDALEVHGLPGGPRYLHTSPEYHMKRLLGAGLPRIVQLCAAHRRDEHGTLHEPAFTMLEWYRAFSDAEQLMADTEALVSEVAGVLCGGTRVATAFGQVDFAPPWERLTVAEAFQRHAGCDVRTLLGDETRFYQTLVERVEPALGRGRPTLLTRYPAQMASLARLCEDDPSCADRFEAYVCGVELCNGFSELTDAAEQRRRFEADLERRAAAGRACPPIDERFLAALEDGLPPSAGNALGFDRLLMLLTGAARVADVMAFPFERA